MAKDGEIEKTETKSGIEILSISARTGTCECCGKKDVPKDKLVRIDSGQLFCPNCLMAFIKKLKKTRNSSDITFI